MGSSYSNVTFSGPDRDRLAAALQARGRTAYVGPTTGGFTVVFDAGIEDEPPMGARELALDVTKELGGLALAATVHDDDVFFFTLVRDGKQLDEYDSNPGFSTGRADPPSGGDTAVLTREFGAPGVVDELEKILRSPAGGDEYTYETTRHSDLADALGLPDHSVGFGFEYVHQGEAEELDGKLLTVGNVDEAETGSDEPPVMPAMPAAPAAASPFGDFAIPGLGADMQAAIAAMHEAGKHPAHGYFPALIAGDAAALRALFASAAVLDDPATGKVEGDDALAAHIAKFRGMLGDRHAEYVALALIETPERTVAQGQMVVMSPGDITTIPAACVWERGEGGAFRSLRAYYSVGSLTGMRGERAPLLEPAADAALPDVLRRHFAALAADDMDAIIATFRADCLSPLPMFPPADAVRRHYGAMLGQNGAVGIQPCLVTADAGRCAVEYVTARWDGSEVPPQAGLAIYELRDGLLCQMQIFAELGPQPVGIGTGGLMDLAGLGGLGGGGGLGGLGALGGGGLAGLEGLGGLGGLGGGGGMGDLSALGGMAELGGPGGMQALQEQMQQMMQQLQGMMGGAGGPGMDAFAGFPAFPGGLPGDELDDGDDDYHDAPSADDDAEPADDGSASSPKPPTEA